MPLLPSTANPPEDLLHRARSGDAEAIDALARWCYPVVYRWALVRTGDGDEADDVTQETMVALPGRLSAFRGESKFTTWLYRVTVNVATATLRVSSRRARLLDRWLKPAAAERAEPRGLTAIHDAQLADLVRTLLVELPPQQRTVFDLTDLQGFSAAEVAEMLELDNATVRSHLMRARRAMRAQMLKRLPSLAEDRA